MYGLERSNNKSSIRIHITNNSSTRRFALRRSSQFQRAKVVFVHDIVVVCVRGHDGLGVLGQRVDVRAALG